MKTNFPYRYGKKHSRDRALRSQVGALCSWEEASSKERAGGGCAETAKYVMGRGIKRLGRGLKRLGKGNKYLENLFSDLKASKFGQGPQGSGMGTLEAGEGPQMVGQGPQGAREVTKECGR